MLDSSFEPTYKGLKRGRGRHALGRGSGFEPTYKGLKHEVAGVQRRAARGF